ncbi:hypothetical protein [Microbacterium amylolyticum]|uniref:Cytidylate kinase n=1 Tax=Microbacterium amylolyticum TaxID=936337 RepID=A0ABS4ZEM6_9MICO|nr:hypothetical protein [Microbacterium amylolyticum]MBP2435734.1 cytidylate kinase [Microbacterium amylolyticum]
MLAGRLNARLVSLDEIYPGWDGLSYATEEAARLVRLHAAGERATYRRWDWTRDEWGEEAAVIDETIPLIVEGCGALTAASASAADASIWMDEDPAVRRQRACDRDGDAMRSQWDRWAAQESAHIAAHNPAGLADMRIDPALSSDLAPE